LVWKENGSPAFAKNMSVSQKSNVRSSLPLLQGLLPFIRSFYRSSCSRAIDYADPATITSSGFDLLFLLRLGASWHDVDHRHVTKVGIVGIV
jgi:hypothetical protein